MVMMGGDVSFIYTLYGTLLPVYEVNKSIEGSGVSGPH